MTIDEALTALQQPSGADCDSNTSAAHVALNCYDAEGNLSKTIDRNGRRRDFDYDFAGRLLTEDWFDADGSHERLMSFTYDAVGNLTTASDPDSKDAFTYDALDRLTSADNNPDGTRNLPRVILMYTYDPEGNLASTQDGMGVTVASEYDQRNRPSVRRWFDADVPDSETADVDPARVDFLYDAAGREVGVARFADLHANQLVGATTRTYDIASRSNLLTHRNAIDNLLAGYDYDYDFSGQLVHESRAHQDPQSEQTVDYRYDLTGQLIDAMFSGQDDEHFEYDPNGNRTHSRSGSEERTYATGTANQIESDTQYEYEYDGEGNLILKREIATGDTTEYAYDHRNRLTRVVQKSLAAC